MLSTATLEMLANMRQQFAGMLADIGFIRAPKGSLNKGSSGAGRGCKGPALWIDDKKAAYNQHALKPAVVSFRSQLCASAIQK